MRDETSERLYILLDQLNQQWSYPMNAQDVFKNDFLHNLGSDHIAVDHTGMPIARATDRAAVERAAPNAAAYFSGADFDAVEQPAEAPIQTPFISAFTVDAVEPVTAEEPAETPDPVVVVPEPETVKPIDEQNQTANQLPDGPETEQPPQDSDHIAPGAEEFPDPVVPTDAEDDTAN